MKPLSLTQLKRRSERMAQTVKVPLVLPYKFGPPQEKVLRDYEGRCAAEEARAKATGVPAGTVRTYDECCRDLSERLIAQAVSHEHGDNMKKTDRRIYRAIQEQLIDDAHELVMDGTAFAWFKGVMTSDKVKVAPGDVSAYETFIESLDHVERAEG